MKLNIYSRGKTIYKEYILDMFMQAMELSDCVSENFNYHSDKFICELPEFELEFQPWTCGITSIVIMAIMFMN